METLRITKVIRSEPLGTTNIGPNVVANHPIISGTSRQITKTLRRPLEEESADQQSQSAFSSGDHGSLYPNCAGMYSVFRSGGESEVGAFLDSSICVIC